MFIYKSAASHRSTQHSTKTKQTKTVRNRSQNTNSVKTLIYNNNQKYIICLTSFINKNLSPILEMLPRDIATKRRDS